MIPENAAENHLPLYRATQFPYTWEYLGPLVGDRALHDATLVRVGDGWWLLANEARDGGSSWDCLSLYRAGNPFGPFEPHHANPVIVDARNSRSAGPVISFDGRLLRPVQSCLAGYGRFIRFMEITAISDDNFSQLESGRILAPMHGPVQGVHTYSTAGGLEAIDALTSRKTRI